MIDTLPSGVAQIVALFVECIFYGLHLVAFGAFLRLAVWSRPELTWQSRLKNFSLMSMIVLSFFVLSTLNIGLGLFRILQAFTSQQSVTSSSASPLGQDWINIVRPLCLDFQTIIADSVLIYRCWVVCARSRRVVIFPILSFLGVIAFAIVSLNMQFNRKSGALPNLERTLHFAMAFWISTLVLNVYATSMIVFRIWRVTRENAALNGLSPPRLFSHQPRSRLQNATRIVIESGLMSTMTTIFAVVTLIVGSASVYIATAVDIQVTGIAFDLILIRVANHAADVTTRAGDLSTTINFARGDSSVTSNVNMNMTGNGMVSRGSIHPKILVQDDSEHDRMMDV